MTALPHHTFHPRPTALTPNAVSVDSRLALPPKQVVHVAQDVQGVRDVRGVTDVPGVQGALLCPIVLWKLGLIDVPMPACAWWERKTTQRGTQRQTTQKNRHANHHERNIATQSTQKTFWFKC